MAVNLSDRSEFYSQTKILLTTLEFRRKALADNGDAKALELIDAEIANIKQSLHDYLNRLLNSGECSIAKAVREKLGAEGLQAAGDTGKAVKEAIELLGVTSAE